MQKEEPFAGIKTTRRQFTGLLCGSGLLGLVGCGGGGGSSSSSTQTGAPQIMVSPQSTSVVAGQSITLRVEASGLNLAYQWRRNGVALSGATDSSLVVVASLADSGARYSVVVSNLAGQVESAAAMLTVTSGAGISLLAGGIGGPGLLEGNGGQARISYPGRVAVGKDGVVYFTVNASCGKISALGDVSFIGGIPGVAIDDIACDSNGTLYGFAFEANVIYKLMADTFSPFAGLASPSSGGGFVDGAGQAARLNGPTCPVFDAQDNLYFIDSGNYAIRKLSSSGAVTTLAGTPANATTADGKGLAAGFSYPRELVALSDGSLLVVDNERWRKVMPDGTVSTLAGTAPGMGAVAGNDVNALYSVSGNSVVKLALDGSTVVVAGSHGESGHVDGVKDVARFATITDLARAPDGKLYVSEWGNELIRRLDPASGQVTTVAGAAPQPGRIDGAGAQARFAEMGPSCVDGDGNVYVMDTFAKTLRKVTPTGTVSTLFNDFPSEGAIAVDASGNFYGVRNRAIVKVAPSGAQQVWAGQTGVLGYADGAGAAASFAKPMGLAFDAQGNLFVGDSPDIVRHGSMYVAGWLTISYGGTIRKITPAGVVSTVAGVPGQIFENIYEADGLGLHDPRYGFMLPRELVCDADGKVWMLDISGIRRIDPQSTTGAIQVLRSDMLGSMAPVVGSPGSVYVSRQSVIIKLAVGGSQTVVAGVDAPYRDGVRLGALPGCLGRMTAIASGAANLLYACSENSVLRIQLA